MERWPGGWPMAASMLLLAFAAALPLWLPGMLALSISAACFGAAMFSIPAAIQSLVKKGLPKPAWGSAMAVFTVVFAAGQIVGPVATGWLADRFGSLRPGLAISAAILFAGAFIASRQREVRAQLKP
jgi:predicted MFS family arabinose efflux permease